MNIDSRLQSKTVSELLGYNFFIPSYQRGYRWTSEQVQALLDDLWQFRDRNPKKDEYYCLQPIVVAENKNDGTNQWELIDGQQRLTTIYILLTYFNKRFTEEFRGKIFSLHYKTREDSAEYLADINITHKDDNIDYHFIYEAYDTIKKWFEDKQPFINDFQSILLNNTRVIWYEANDSSVNPIDIFTRINIGKIPLTNSELIKALFLQKENFLDNSELKQIQIAAEWDIIEKKLQDHSFWYFIYNPKVSTSYENRIEYIFDLIMEKKRDHDFYYTFNCFNKIFQSNKGDSKITIINDMWLNVKKYFLLLEEWYHERDLYHMIGFLVEQKMDINRLIKDSADVSKTTFKEILKNQIKSLFKDVQLSELSFGPNKSDIKKTLLLFNIQTIIATQKADMRFPFDKYKTEKWDIEHVNSQTEKTINSSDRKVWARDILEFFLGMPYEELDTATNSDSAFEPSSSDIDESRILDYVSRLKKIVNDQTDSDDFEELYNELLIEFNETESGQNDSISNLTLLDSTTNRSYGNAMFPIKRKRIIENDMNGIFVPICTKNLFLKYYSKKIDKPMFWQKSDSEDYMKSIALILNDYLPTQNKKTNA